jgi:hypothetical protein
MMTFIYFDVTQRLGLDKILSCLLIDCLFVLSFVVSVEKSDSHDGADSDLAVVFFLSHVFALKLSCIFFIFC